jgi:histidinol phosphatase-like enzyme (inositol monophosphatase family)
VSHSSALISTQDDLAFAERLAEEARPLALEHFRVGTHAEAKPAQEFDPVTAADRGVEARLRSLIEAAHPKDGIVGEEQAERASRNGRTWVIDPIDGTRAFLAGLPTWMVMIALSEGEGPKISVLDQPFTGERFSGVTGQAAWLSREGKREPIRVRSGVTRLEDAILSTTDPGLFTAEELEQFRPIADGAKLRRYGLDAYGYAALALGGIDLVIESGLKAWDVAALVPVVTGAGGVITNWRGEPCQDGGQVVAASSAQLHARALERLSLAAA